MNDPFERRTRASQQALRDHGAAGLVLFPGPNLYYLTGLDVEPSERYFLFIVPADGTPILFIPAMAEPRVREETWVERVVAYSDESSPRDRLEQLLLNGDLGSGRILVDDHLWARFTLTLRSILRDRSFGLASEVMETLRIRKDDTEREAMRAAATLTDEVCAALRESVDVLGRTETALAREIEDRQRAAGGAGQAFETIVAAGPNGARPHHGHGDRMIRAGDPVVFDFGTVLNNYVSDQTRTMVFHGEPPREFESVFDAVIAAQHAAVEAVAPGVTCASVDRAARSEIADRGYGDAFVHRTGHGVGLEVHEPPYIVAGNDRELEPGMVFSVEPGAYLEGHFGVRIEDLVIVTHEGCERLNDSPREWRVR